MTGITILHCWCLYFKQLQYSTNMFTWYYQILKKKNKYHNSFLIFPFTNSSWRLSFTLLAGWILPYLISSMLLLTETFSLSNVEKSVFLPKLAKTNFPYVQKKKKRNIKYTKHLKKKN